MIYQFEYSYNVKIKSLELIDVLLTKTVEFNNQLSQHQVKAY